jgi:beta-glucuronidase
MHSAYPSKALFVTEFGAEANREGPIDEKGTYAFQQDFLRFHLATYAARPFINGALIWILRDFRVKPGWEGGNPKPVPPVNFKGLVATDGREKPSFEEVARIFRATRQLR